MTRDVMQHQLFRLPHTNSPTQDGPPFSRELPSSIITDQQQRLDSQDLLPSPLYYTSLLKECVTATTRKDAHKL